MSDPALAGVQPANSNPMPTAPSEPAPAPAPEVKAAPEATAAPVTPEPVPAAPAPSEPAPTQPIKTTGNEVFDSVAAVLSAQGVNNVNEVLGELAGTGELSLATKAALLTTEGASAAVVEMAINNASAELKRAADAKTASGARVKEQAFAMFGGENAEATWESMGTFVNSGSFSDSERETLNELLSKESTAVFALKEIQAKYAGSQTYTHEPTLLQGNTATATGFTPLSKQDYVSQVREAVQKYGQDSREVKALQQQRLTSIQRGF